MVYKITKNKIFSVETENVLLLLQAIKLYYVLIEGFIVKHVVLNLCLRLNLSLNETIRSTCYVNKKK